MPKIEIGKAGSRSLKLDLETLLKTRLLIQANSGGGKSWLLRRLAEELFGKVQVLLIDREGEFPTLREKFGYVLVGQGGDTPADLRSARLLAEKLLELNASAVCDLYEAFRTRPGDRRAWVRGFLEAVLDAPKKFWRPLAVIVDEAHAFCPESLPKAASPIEREMISGCKDAMVSLATVGRKRGFAAIWATQRLAKLDKDASAELLNRLVGMTFEDVDVDRAADLMSVSKDERASFKASLKNLDPGNFFAFGRAISKERVLVKVGPVRTTHPEPGSAAAASPPPPPEKVKAMLPKLKDLPKEVESRAKTEAELRNEIKALKSELVRKPKAPAPMPAAPKIVKIQSPAVKAEQIARLERALGIADRASGKIEKALLALRDFSGSIRESVKKLSGHRERDVARPFMGIPAQSTVKSARIIMTGPAPVSVPQRERNGELDKAARSILIVLAQHPEGCEAGKLALLAGYRLSGGFRNSLSSLRTRGYMTGQNTGVMAITEDGRQALGDYEPLPTGEELARYWLGHPSFGQAERRTLEALLAHPEGIGGPELAEKAGYHWSGGFRNTLSKLRTAGVLVGRNTELMKPNNDLLVDGP